MDRQRVVGEGTGIADPITAQQTYWTDWNEKVLASQRGPTSQRQAAIVDGWLRRRDRQDLDILDVGCGSGWMAKLLASFGNVTATDLCSDVLAVAQQKWPHIRFVAGDFMAMEFPDESRDIVVTLEVLSHVADQAAFIRRMARILRPGGQLMIATQNRFVFERWAEVAPRSFGNIRHWVNPRELRNLLEADFVIEELCTVNPVGQGGILRVVNSVKLNRMASAIVSQATLDKWKENVGLGHTIMALARKD
jgi:2-polyprenyl-3-methyl-5-hydroxy-6-metoxy-1,4-benzoquinol methylase